MKSALRSQIKSKIALLSVEEKREKSLRIVQKVLENKHYCSAKRIGIYLSLIDEVQTHKIIEDIFNKSKTCFIPRYDRDKMEMVRLAYAEEYRTFPKTAWNISQPSLDNEREEAMDKGGLDVLIMPGRAFTLSGDRLGRGGGYYDKYLKQYRDRYNCLPYTIGLAFSEQISENIVTESHDQKISTVIFD